MAIAVPMRCLRTGRKDRTLGWWVKLQATSRDNERGTQQYLLGSSTIKKCRFCWAKRHPVSPLRVVFRIWPHASIFFTHSSQVYHFYSVL